MTHTEVVLGSVRDDPRCGPGRLAYLLRTVGIYWSSGFVNHITGALVHHFHPVRF